MSEFAVEDMDFNGADNDAGAYDYEDWVVLTLGSGSGSGSGGGGGKAGPRQVYGATPAPGSRSAPGPRHRKRRSSFLVSHGVSSFWYGLCSVALLVIVLVSPCSLVFLYLSSPISLNDPSIRPVFASQITHRQVGMSTFTPFPTEHAHNCVFLPISSRLSFFLLSLVSCGS
ncbi:hypothetical protein CSOJ01_09040 [Colletotrichum sojae]|uniref:Uncharacterized protein n=1 Tax=Colletotrichum sojae TaxID=2175907 RepID=A0A8H6J442_9PEZI|nr:hypothetical protein CSOJ01_09040 [Colletotrichum sojae]